MRISKAVEIVKKMKGWMPESTRTYLAQLLLDGVTSELDKGQLKTWNDLKMSERFMRGCNLTEPMPSVKPSMEVSETPLSEFCNKWMAVEKYREPGGEFVPLTSDMHSIRVTIINELRELSDGR